MPVLNARRRSTSLVLAISNLKSRLKFASTQPSVDRYRLESVSLRFRVEHGIRLFQRRRRVSRNQLADYYLNGYWYDSAYLRVVHHGANSTVVILISGDLPHPRLVPHPLAASLPLYRLSCCCCFPPRALVPTTYTATRAALSPLHPVSAAPLGRLAA